MPPVLKKSMRTAARRYLSMNESYLKLIKYVNAATDMAESLERDIKAKDRKVSNDTVLALSKFVAAANSVQKMLDQVERDTVKLN